MRKSSGFSSVSSLLSANENPIMKKCRSSSMPSICIARFSSFDTENLSLESQSELTKIKRQPESFIEKPISSRSDHSNNPLETNEIYRKNKSNIRQKRFPSTDLIGDNQIRDRMKHNPRSMDNILLEQKSKSGKNMRMIQSPNRIV